MNKGLSSLFTDRQVGEWKNWVIPLKSAAQSKAEPQAPQFGTLIRIPQFFPPDLFQLFLLLKGWIDMLQQYL